MATALDGERDAASRFRRRLLVVLVAVIVGGLLTLSWLLSTRAVESFALPGDQERLQRDRQAVRAEAQQFLLRLGRFGWDGRAARGTKVLATGVSAIDADSATALVAGTFTDGHAKAREPSPFRIEVTLVKTGDEWLVDDFTPVAGEQR